MIQKDKNDIEIIKQTLNCSEIQAEKVASYLHDAGIVLPLDKAEASNETNKLYIESSGKKFEVMFTKKFSVSSIKDIQADKYIFSVYQ